LTNGEFGYLPPLTNSKAPLLNSKLVNGQQVNGQRIPKPLTNGKFGYLPPLTCLFLALFFTK
jgi:hypothetical protein